MFEDVLNLLARWFGPVAEAPLAPDAAASANAPALTTEELGEVQNLVRRATEVTSTVAEHVGNHQTTIQTLNTALAAVAHGDATAVAAVVCKLLLANQELQGQLERAELKLEVHSRQLNDAVTAARTDSLTGLLNRRAFDEELSRCLAAFQRRARPAALMLLDVDRFKRFNDVHGHVGGDHALTYVADILRTHSRDSDVVARFGGEEFAVIFAGATAAAVQQRAEEIRGALAQGRVIFAGREARLTASAGLAEVTPNDDMEAWMKRADTALYAAKGGGRNCSFCCDTDWMPAYRQQSGDVFAAIGRRNAGRRAAPRSRSRVGYRGFRRHDIRLSRSPPDRRMATRRDHIFCCLGAVGSARRVGRRSRLFFATHAYPGRLAPGP